MLLIALLSAWVLIGGSVFAQDKGSLLDTPDAGGFSDADIRAMSSQERLSSSAEAIDRMRGVLVDVGALLEKTRTKDRDVLKLNCINSKLSAIKAFVKLAERANVALQGAASKKDQAGQTHQTKLILLADVRVQSLRDETQTCTSDDSVPYTGPSRTIIEIDGNILKDAPIDADTEVVPIEPLPEVSPYQ